MAGAKVTQFEPAGTLDGAEIAGVVKNGTNVQTTTADIAALSLGSAANTEFVQDTIGGILTDDGLAVVTYDDATPFININVPAAAASDINTGTDTTKALTADALAGSNLGTAVVCLQVSDPNGDAITIGDGKAYFSVPAVLNGMNLINVEMALTAVSTSGDPTVQIANVTDAVDMLSTKLSVDANDLHSKDATTPAVIDTTKDDVATGDLLRIDNDVAGTDAKGQMVILTFQLP